MAARGPYKPVTPVISNGILYSAEGDGIDQYVVAVDPASCNVLWKVRIFHNNIWSWLEEDIQWVFITNLQVAGNSLLVTDEGSRRYWVDLTTIRVEKLWFGGFFARLFSTPAPADPHPSASGKPETALCPSGILIPGRLGNQPGPPERTLAGVTVNRTTLSDLKKRLPARWSLKTNSPGSGVSSIIWEEAGTWIYVSFTGQMARAVAVNGEPTFRSKTGRGLALGQSAADLERIYGSYYRSWPGDYYFLRWNDGTELRVHVYHPGGPHAATVDQISSIELIASVN
jgi:hypothetical protein